MKYLLGLMILGSLASCIAINKDKAEVKKIMDDIYDEAVQPPTSSEKSK